MKLEKMQNNMIFNKKIVWRVWSIWLFLNLSLLIIASRQTAEAGSRIACIYRLRCGSPWIAHQAC